MHDTFDLLIRNASIVDGTGEPRYAGDIGMRGDRIARIGDLVGRARRRRRSTSRGRIAAPGFIDAHTHDDRLMLSGPGHGAQGEPGRDHRDRRQLRHLAGADAARRCPHPVTPPLNLLDDAGRLVPLPQLRRLPGRACARSRPPPTARCWWATRRCAWRRWTTCRSRPAPAEIAAMRELVDEALQAGAIGVSTGLFYEPAIAAPTEEVIEVCRPLTDTTACTARTCATRPTGWSTRWRRPSASAASSACRW